MSYSTALRVADQRAQQAFDLFHNVDSIDSILHEHMWEVDTLLQESYNRLLILDEHGIAIPARDLALSDGIKDLDCVQLTVHRMNLALFTTSLWSNTDYDGSVSNFFSMLIPKQLHDRDDTIDLFLEIVARWTVVSIRWTINQQTEQDIIDRMRRRINIELKDEDPVLIQKVKDAFMKRYGHLDPSIPLYDLRDMFDPKRVQEAWSRVLPTVLKAIDDKVSVMWTWDHVTCVNISLSLSYYLPHTINLGSFQAPILIPDDDQDKQVKKESTTRITAVRSRPRRAAASSRLQSHPTTTTATRQRTETPRWTKEEEDALCKGLEVYGRQWVKIKAEYPIFTNRTNIQIRDKAKSIAQKRRRHREPLRQFAGCG